MTGIRPLAVVGNVNVDLILGPVPAWPQPGTETMVEHDALRVGGAAGNVALVWMDLGISHQIAGNTGDDHYGQWLRTQFMPAAESWPVEAGPSTLSVGITHPDGERTFLTTRGHLSALHWLEVRDMLDWSALKGGYLLLCGSFITDALSADYDALFTHARAHDVAVALDTGWPPEGWGEALKARTRHWLAQSACCFFNAGEAAALTGIDAPEQSATALRDLLAPEGLAVVKCGADGALAVGADGTLHRAAAPYVTVIDTIGAGDVFNAIFLAARAAGACVAECLAQGVRAASCAISTEPRRYDTDLSTEIAHERT